MIYILQKQRHSISSRCVCTILVTLFTKTNTRRHTRICLSIYLYTSRSFYLLIYQLINALFMYLQHSLFLFPAETLLPFLAIFYLKVLIYVYEPRCFCLSIYLPINHFIYKSINLSL